MTDKIGHSVHIIGHSQRRTSSLLISVFFTNQCPQKYEAIETFTRVEMSPIVL